MFSLAEPTPLVVHRFLEQQAAHETTYTPRGPIDGLPPAGFVVDQVRFCLGNGRDVYARAENALIRWRQFDLGWVRLVGVGPRIAVGEVVAVAAHVAGCWSMNACRIIETIDESTPHRRFGFVYATLPGHVARGAERFLVEFSPDDESVWFEICAVSRPNALAARLARPLFRHWQDRFRSAAAAAMQHAVEAPPA